MQMTLVSRVERAAQQPDAAMPNLRRLVFGGGAQGRT